MIPRDRIDELLADDALFGLSDEERRELAALGAPHDDSFALAAAAIDLATLELAAMPPSLQAKILTGAPAAAPPRRPLRALPWLAAAACAALAAGGWYAYATKAVEPRIVEVPVPPPPPARSVEPRRPTLAEEREALARAADARTIAWGKTKDPASKAVAGDVVWSPSQQRGYMRFVGLPMNDPTKNEYQLWVFDGAQEHPIDGGVFDVTESGEVIVPIAAKLKVVRPTLFAVTIEKPGGVVVSKKERIVAVAPVNG